MGGGAVKWRRIAGALALLMLAFALLLAGAEPALASSHFTDYDTDDNGLIEVDSLTKLDAIRYDLDGDGITTATEYGTAFPDRKAAAPNAMGCPASGCIGYELTDNLDFDTGTAGDRTDDQYYNGGAGWQSIGVDSTGADTDFTATFDGKGHTISNLFINLTTSTAAGGGYVGLFGDSTGTITNVGLVNPDITNTRTGGGWSRIGALLGRNNGGGATVSNSYVSGGSVTLDQSTATGAQGLAGCLVGYSNGTIRDSWASCAVSAAGTNPDPAGSAISAGGLIGSSDHTISGSYATGTVNVSGTIVSSAGGLSGHIGGNVTDSYAVGTVTSTSNPSSGESNVGGLVGSGTIGLSIRASYAAGNVSASAPNTLIGGLGGALRMGAGDVVQSSYAAGSVSASGANSFAGGLLGRIWPDANGLVQGSYATGAVTSTGAGGTAGGLVGINALAVDTPMPVAANAYWDTETTGQSASIGGGQGQTTQALREPAGYAGIYQDWNLNLDGQAGNDDPWDFGNFCDYPVLKYGGLDVSRQRGAAADDFPDNDVTFYSGQTVTLTAANRGATAYLWEQIQDADGHAVTLSGAETAQVSFMAPAGLDDAVELNFKLTLLADGVCRTDLVKVTILPAQPNELSDLAVTAGGTVRPLTPAFASSGRSFDTYVGAYTGRAEIAMTPADADATISFNRGAPAAGARTETVSLAGGHNRFTITVTPPEREAPADGGDDAADAAEPLEPVTYHLNIRRQRTPKLAFNPPHYLLMDEGETATYTVELDTRWLGAEVIINISSDNPDITVSPDTVSISQYDWSERTIEVTAAKDADGDDDYATIRHIANGGHYNNVGGRLRVEVSDDDIIPTPTPAPTPTPTPQPTPTPTPGPTPPPVASADRTTELVLDGRTVTITREAGALLGASVSLPSRLTRDLTITYAPMIPGLPLSSSRYGLGMTPEAQSGTTLTVVGVPAGGLELCLPVPSALASEAGARPLTLVRYEGAGWNALPGAVHRATEVCAPNISSGVFAAAYVMPQLGPPSGLTVMPGDAPGTLVLRWTPGNDATRHWVAGIKQSDLDAGDMSSSLIWTAASGADTHTVSGLDSGAEYVFAVAAGRGDEWSGWTGLVRGMPE